MNLTIHSMKRAILLTILTIGCSMKTAAEVVWSGEQNIVIPQDVEGLYINPLTGEATNFFPSNWDTDPWLNVYWGGTVIWSNSVLRPVVVNNAYASTGQAQVANVAEGTTLDGLSLYALQGNGSGGGTPLTHMGSDPDQFQHNAAGYLGFVMQRQGEDAFYGWARVQFGPSPDTGMLISHAYENTPNTAITVGQIAPVPEPSGIALMASIVGLAAVRRRR